MGDSKVRWQLKIFLLCWFAYALIYFGRVNLSIAVPQLVDHFSSSETKIGMLGSLFFWFYALGQLLSCAISDRINSKLLIFIGLITTGVTNLLFSFSNVLVFSMVLWALNGIGQSLLWGNIVKTSGKWFSPKQYTKVMVGLNTSMVLGYIMGWGGCGVIVKYFSWRAVFLTPGLILIVFAMLWALFAKEKPSDVNIVIDDIDEYTEKIEVGHISQISYKQLFIGSGLIFVILACVAQSMVKEGIGVWAPSMITQIYKVDMTSATGYVLFIPIMNLFGILASGEINKRFKNKDEISTVILFLAAIISLGILGLFPASGFLLGVLCLGICSAAMYGANTMLLGTLPIRYAKYGRAAFVTGFLNFCSYLGAGVSSTLVGVLADLGFGYTGTFLIWAIITLVATISLIISIKVKTNQI